MKRLLLAAALLACDREAVCVSAVCVSGVTSQPIELSIDGEHIRICIDENDADRRPDSISPTEQLYDEDTDTYVPLYEVRNVKLLTWGVGVECTLDKLRNVHCESTHEKPERREP